MVVRVNLCGEETKDKLQDGDLGNRRDLFSLQACREESVSKANGNERPQSWGETEARLSFNPQ